MQRRQFLSYVTASTCVVPLACGLSGCGTILHGDRVGQPHTHQLDWKVAALDGLGMLLFFVPGVVAFCVDFYTGAIYIPYDEYQTPQYSPVPSLPTQPNWGPPPSAPATPQPTAPAPLTSMPATAAPGLKRFEVPRQQLNPQTIQQVVSTQVGRPVSLDDENARMSNLAKLDAFEKQRQRHESDNQFGFNIRRFFERFQNA
ncbi:hypothetical protein GC197_03225 [bacterium]|nr:hypothetical protein [bacterium]